MAKKNIPLMKEKLSENFILFPKKALILGALLKKLSTRRAKVCFFRKSKYLEAFRGKTNV
jgi:hypothetical protein